VDGELAVRGDGFQEDQSAPVLSFARFACRCLTKFDQRALAREILHRRAEIGIRKVNEDAEASILKSLESQPELKVMWAEARWVLRDRKANGRNNVWHNK
jgi:hypothetical protein